MPRGNFPLYSLNGGEVGTDAIARFDLDRLRYAAVLQDNFFPHVIGKMQLRPGFEDLDSYVEGVRMIPFVVSGSVTYMLVFTPNRMEVMRGGEYLTREAVSTTIPNGDFNAFTAWTDASTGGASAAVSGGNLVLSGASGGVAIARQQVIVPADGNNREQGLTVDVVRGPVTIRIGSSSGLDNHLSVTLEEGSHTLNFRPSAIFWIDLITAENREIIVNSVGIASAGRVSIDTPWDADALRTVRFDQSFDVLFMASDGFQQRRLERRGDTSWSLVRYKTSDGPFTVSPETTTTVTPSVLVGNGSLTASEPIFSSLDVGSLFRATHSQQLVEETFTAIGQFTRSIRVIGVGSTARTITVTVLGDSSWDGMVALQQSIAEEGDWVTVETYTGVASGGGFGQGETTTQTFNDDLDNQIVFYRLIVSEYTAGTAEASIRYNGGSTTGVVRIVGFTSETVVNMEVLEPFGSTGPSSRWDRGTWSDRNGWPDTVALHDGRLFWGRGDVVYGSESDRFNSFSDTSTGDAAPIIRSIGATTQQGVLWLQSLQRLVAGTDVSEISIRASSFDEPLTASAFAPRRASTRGCFDLQPVEVDTSAIFVQRSGSRIFDLVLDGAAQDYVSRDITELHTDVCKPGVISIAVQRQPDTRIWFVLSNGEVRCLTYEPSENIVAWSRVSVDGFVEDVEVLPSEIEDEVYIAVNRNIAGSTQRRIERLGRFENAVGGQINQIMDSFVHISHSTPSATISGLDHLNGEQVVVWADGRAIRDQENMATVSGGTIPNTTAYSEITVGVPYNARWRSTKLAYGAAQGTALGMYKRVNHLGLYMVDVVLEGVRIGRDFNNLQQLSSTDRGRGNAVDFNLVKEEYDQDLSNFGGRWDVDSRICIEARAPYPVSVATLVIAMTTNDR